MTPTISLYFARFFFGHLWRTTLGITFLIFLIDFIEFARRAAGIPGFTFTGGMYTSLLRLPSLLETYAPFIVLIAAMSSMLTLNKRSELVITRASGLSAWQFIAPFCAVAFVIGVMSITALNPLSARTLAMVQDREAELGLTPVGARELVPFFRQSTSDGGSIIIGASSVARGGQLLIDATLVFFNAEGDLTKRIDAGRALLSENRWVLADAWIHVDGDKPKFLKRQQIESTLPPDFITRTLTPAEIVPLFELPAQVAAARIFGIAPAPYLMQFHALLATPALIAAMALIAATVSLRYARFGQAGSAILGGIAAGFLLYVVTTMVKAFGASGIVSPLIAAWLPVVVAVFFGVTFLLHREDG